MSDNTNKIVDEDKVKSVFVPEEVLEKQPDVVRKPRIVEESVTSCGGGS